MLLGIAVPISLIIVITMIVIIIAIIESVNNRFTKNQLNKNNKLVFIELIRTFLTIAKQ